MRCMQVCNFDIKASDLLRIKKYLGKNDSESSSNNQFALIKQCISLTKVDNSLDDVVSRKDILVLLRLLWLKANAQLESIEQEQQLLRTFESQIKDEHSVGESTETT